jgi:hypothetical protein
MRNVYKILAGKPRRRWEDNVIIDRRELCWESVDWIELALDRDK